MNKAAIALTRLIIKKCTILDRLHNHEYADDTLRTKDIKEMMQMHEDITDLKSIVLGKVMLQ